jgi:hypothetical protein
VVAADAGPKGIEWIGGAVLRCAESVHRRRTEDPKRGILVGETSLLTVDDREQREEEMDCAGRRRGAPSAETHKTLVMSIVVSCGNRDRERWGVGCIRPQPFTAPPLR